MLVLASRPWKFFNLKIQNQAKLYCSTLPYPFQSHTLEIQTHSNPMHCELAQVWCLQRSLDWFISMGSFTYTFINSSPWSMVTKKVLRSLEKKEKGEQTFIPCLKKKREKRKKRGRCVVIYKTTMDLFSSITCTWPKRWTSRLLRDTRFDLAI